MILSNRQWKRWGALAIAAIVASCQIVVDREPQDICQTDCSSLDAGITDAGSPDGGPPITPDAGSPIDAGTAVDAGTAIDAGAEIDAGVAIDAGPFDAGSSPCGQGGACISNADCGGPAVCLPACGVCGACTSDSDCAENTGGSACLTDGGCGSTASYQASCSTSADCAMDGAGSLCIGALLGGLIPGTCGCTRDSQCAYAGGTCDTTNEVCTGTDGGPG